MYQFVLPPSVILDLGCGGGYWALEAAKQWPVCSFLSRYHRCLTYAFQESTVVGFDIKAIQPNLSGLSGIYNDLASRVRWVHGNLYVLSFDITFHTHRVSAWTDCPSLLIILILCVS